MKRLNYVVQIVENTNHLVSHLISCPIIINLKVLESQCRKHKGRFQLTLHHHVWNKKKERFIWYHWVAYCTWVSVLFSSFILFTLNKDKKTTYTIKTMLQFKMIIFLLFILLSCQIVSCMWFMCTTHLVEIVNLFNEVQWMILMEMISFDKLNVMSN